MVVGSPAIGQRGCVFFTSESGALLAIDVKTGGLRWGFRAGPFDSRPVTGAGGAVFCGSEDHFLYCLDETSRKLRWKRRLASPIGFQPIVAKDGALYATSADHLYKLDAKRGGIKWEKKLFGVLATPTIGGSGTLYVSSRVGGRGAVFGVASSSGRLLWKRDFVRPMESPAMPVDSRSIVVEGADYALHKLDSRTGREVWQIPSGPPVGPGVKKGKYDNRIFSMRVLAQGERCTAASAFTAYGF